MKYTTRFRRLRTKNNNVEERRPLGRAWHCGGPAGPLQRRRERRRNDREQAGTSRAPLTESSCPTTEHLQKVTLQLPSASPVPRLILLGPILIQAPRGRGFCQSSSQRHNPPRAGPQGPAELARSSLRPGRSGELKTFSTLILCIERSPTLDSCLCPWHSERPRS